MTHNDYEKEPIPGLPAHLPDGEHILWQGTPDQGSFLRNVLHGRKIVFYFGALIAWRVGTGIYDGNGLINTATTFAWLLVLGACVLALAWWFARAVERTTIYTITNKRIVMRFGVALPVTFNYPFSQIVSADVQQLENGCGTIALTLKEHTKISWAILWPHARPWKFAKPQPAMRTLGEVDNVARLLAESLSAAHAFQPVKIVVEQVEPEARQHGAAGELNMEGARAVG